MEKIIQKQIIVDKGVKKRICKETGRCFAFVKGALEGDTSTPARIRIRKRAIEMGGVEVDSEELVNN